jgi:hypothetical protein
MSQLEFQPLKEHLTRIPAIDGAVGCGVSEDGRWWAKFAIDIDHPLAWNVVQELGHVLNYLSLNDRLPALFKPVSPSPYINGGPKDFLSWVIESQATDFTPEKCAEWLEGRLPRPVDKLKAGSPRMKKIPDATSSPVAVHWKSDDYSRFP